MKIIFRHLNALLRARRVWQMLGCVLLVGLAFTRFASASIITVTFHGDFHNVSPSVSPIIPEGTLYSATIQYDDRATGPINFTPSVGDSFDAQIGAYTVHGVPESYRVLPGNFTVMALVPAGSIPGLIDPVTMTLDLLPDETDFFDPNHLPDSFVGLDESSRGFRIKPSGGAATANVGDLLATSVPEPQTGVLSGMGVFGLVVVWRRRFRERRPNGA